MRKRNGKGGEREKERKQMTWSRETTKSVHFQFGREDRPTNGLKQVNCPMSEEEEKFDQKYIPHCTAGEKDNSLEFLVVKEIIERPKTSILTKGITIQVRIVTVKREGKKAKRDERGNTKRT